VIKIKNENKKIQSITSKEFYWHLINNNDHTPSCIAKWHTKYSTLDNNITLQWKSIFQNAFLLCRNTKLQSFQYRIIHRTIACNHWLFNIKILNYDTCDFCNECGDTIEHFFLLCLQVNKFWVSFNNWWVGITQHQLIDLGTIGALQPNILFGFPGKSDEIYTLNYCLLHAKFYIYNKKILKLNDLFILEFLVYLKTNLSHEKAILKSQNRSHKFKKFENIFNNL